MTSADTIIVSDVHLGSGLSRVSELLSVLDSWSFERLILLGDIFDNLNLNRLNKLHWSFLHHIKKISKHREIVWIEGNHDEGIVRLIPCLLNVRACREYAWNYGGKNYFAIHGHQFDDFITNNQVITEVACSAYRFMQRLDTNGSHIRKFLKSRSKTYLRLSNKIASDAVEYGKNKGADYVFCGHTHQAAAMRFEEVHYYNAGCWTDSPANYVSIGRHGVELHHVD